MPIIECTNVSKQYQRRPYGIKERLVGKHNRPGTTGYARKLALRDVSFSVERGSAFGVVGKNGAGKSTLLSLLLGVIEPDSGEVRMNGRVASLLDLGCGFHPELTGRENILLYGSILGESREYMKNNTASIIEFSELGDAVDHPIRTYSSGMIARLGFATIIHTQSDILLIDEVLAVGDSAFQAKCRDYLKLFRRRKGTLVIVSHDMNPLKDICDAGIYLENGQIIHAGSIDSVLHRYQTNTMGN